MRLPPFPLLLAAALAISACATQADRAIPPAQLSSTQHPPVQVYLNVPRAGTPVTIRGSRYISPATQSVQINELAFNTTPASPGCTLESNVVACQFTIDAPNLGIANFKVVTYDQPLTSSGAVQGNQLSSGSAQVNIVSGIDNVVKVTTLGTPARMTLTGQNLSPPMGTPVTVPLSYSVQDADGYTIVGSFSVPVVVDATFSGNGYYVTQDGYPASPVNLDDQNQTLAIAYPGTGAPGTITARVYYGPVLATLTFDPQQTYAAEIPVDTPLDGATAMRVQSSSAPYTYVTEPAKRSIAVYQGSGPITEYATPSGGTPGHLSFGTGDGAIFPEDNNALGSIGTVNGQMTIQDTVLPATPNAGFFEALDEFGTIFITEYNIGKIAQYTPGGSPAFIEIPTGGANSTPAGLTGWSSSAEFADPGANEIDQVGYGNAIKHFPALTPAARPMEISATYDTGSVFTEPGANRIGDLAGATVTEYACGGTPIALQIYNDVAVVLTSAGKLDIFPLGFGTMTGSYTEITPPSSSSGPVAGIGNGGPGDLILLRSNGVTGAIQDFYFE